MKTSWIVHTCVRTSAAVVIAVAAAPPLSAEVLHDQRGMVLDGTANGHVDAMISGAGSSWGEIRDQQACDDFVLAADTRITRVTVDIVLWDSDGETPIGAPAGGFLVEFFSDVAGTPSESPEYATTSMTFSNLGTFTPPPTPAISEAETGTFAIELPGQGAFLNTGVWWVSVVWIDETPFGQRYKWVGMRQPEVLTGRPAHDRAGGDDHGNGYPGQQVNYDWRSSSGLTNHPRELSFMIEATKIPSADLDADGTVGSGDLAILLGGWGVCKPSPNPCAGDLDGDGSVTSADLAILLGAWGTAG